MDDGWVNNKLGDGGWMDNEWMGSSMGGRWKAQRMA